MRLLVIGAREDSLGEAVVHRANHEGWDVVTAGLGSGERRLDLVSKRDVVEFLDGQQFFQAVVCCAGVNLASRVDDEDFSSVLSIHLHNNVRGPMNLLSAWVRRLPLEPSEILPTFAVISSNSAVVPRRFSTGYCASKAALSMAIRCAARELAGRAVIFGYEPGYIPGTQMSEFSDKTFDAPSYRVPGKITVSKVDLARRIEFDLSSGDRALNGCLIRIDGGEC